MSKVQNVQYIKDYTKTNPLVVLSAYPASWEGYPLSLLPWTVALPFHCCYSWYTGVSPL